MLVDDVMRQVFLVFVGEVFTIHSGKFFAHQFAIKGDDAFLR